MQFIDSHCHIHEADYPLDAKTILEEAAKVGVIKVVCIGTDVKTSTEAIGFAADTENCWASVGLHPHDAKLGLNELEQIKALVTTDKVVAIGEAGLDYYYNYSDKQDQIKALEFQMQMALNYNLPMVFHIRDAFMDFWPVFDNFKNLKGVVHSFTAGTVELEQALKRGLMIGLNGIMTFTKDYQQLEAAKNIPLNMLMLETDAPFLTPNPLRGKINEPKNVKLIAEFLADLRGEDLGQLAAATTENTSRLYGI